MVTFLLEQRVKMGSLFIKQKGVSDDRKKKREK
jgi:hypothetical protein